jgi:hypothetical protein
VFVLSVAGDGDDEPASSLEGARRVGRLRRPLGQPSLAASTATRHPPRRLWVEGADCDGDWPPSLASAAVTR